MVVHVGAVKLIKVTTAGTLCSKHLPNLQSTGDAAKIQSPKQDDRVVKAGAPTMTGSRSSCMRLKAFRMLCMQRCSRAETAACSVGAWYTPTHNGCCLMKM